MRNFAPMRFVPPLLAASASPRPPRPPLCGSTAAAADPPRRLATAAARGGGGIRPLFRPFAPERGGRIAIPPVAFSGPPRRSSDGEGGGRGRGRGRAAGPPPPPLRLGRGGGDGGGGGVRPDGADPSPFSMSRALLFGQALPLLKGFGAVAAGCAALILGALYVNQDRMLYIPEIEGAPRRNADNPPGYRSPAEYGIPFEEHRIRADDGVSIHSWLLLRPESGKGGGSAPPPTIVFLHGNAGNIGIRLPNAQQMYERLGSNVFLVEYRGYGDSDDVRPTEAGLRLDAEAAYRFIAGHPSVDPDRIVVFGRSLGGAVGFHLARYAEARGGGGAQLPPPPLSGLIVENTFVSVGRMVDALLPFLSPFKALVLRIGWDSGEIAADVKVPILYLAGDRDEIVPHSHMRELYGLSRKSGARARMHVVRGGTHNETWMQGGRAYWEAMREFVSECTGGNSRGKAA